MPTPDLTGSIVDRHRRQPRLRASHRRRPRGPGADVVGVARDGAALDDLQRELGPSFTPVSPMSPTTRSPIRLIADPPAEHLVLNAGATPHAGDAPEQTWKTFARTGTSTCAMCSSSSARR